MKKVPKRHEANYEVIMRGQSLPPQGPFTTQWMSSFKQMKLLSLSK